MTLLEVGCLEKSNPEVPPSRFSALPIFCLVTAGLNVPIIDVLEFPDSAFERSLSLEQQKNLPDRVEPPELFTVSAWSCETLASKELSLRECSVVHESRSASISITNQPTVSTPAIHHRVAKCKALRSQLSAARGLRHVNALRLPWLNCSAHPLWSQRGPGLPRG